ncbi:hypothetical protein ACVI1L_004524 [Bradyrhizobium sp. USDA 4516]|nr:hypothetical protein [Bradyrhizobium sp. USDA 4541]
MKNLKIFEIQWDLADSVDSAGSAAAVPRELMTQRCI